MKYRYTDKFFMWLSSRIPQACSRDSIQDFLTFKRIPDHNPWLDLIRVIGIFVVLFYHGQIGYVGRDALARFIRWVDVSPFLVLSGYLIGRYLIRRHNKPFFLFNYLVSRALRILPTYYTVAALTAFGVFPFYSVEIEHIWKSFFIHIFMLHDYISSDINIAFWYLGVQEKFYIIAPLLVFILFRLRSFYLISFLFITLILMSFGLRTLKYISIGMPSQFNAAFFFEILTPFHLRLEPFILGLTVAIIEQYRRGGLGLSIWLSKKVLFWCFFAWFLLGGFQAFRTSVSFWDSSFIPLLSALLFTVFIVGCVALSNENLPGESFFRIIAHLSYTLYLVHFPLIPVSVEIAKNFVYETISFWFIYLLLSFLIALIVHFTVEKPFLYLRNFVSYKFYGRD